MKKQLLVLSLLVINIMMAQIPSYVPTNGLSAYYPFTGNANDASGGGNNGTVNGVSLVNDRLGNPNSAYSFNGSSNNINLPQPFLNGVQVNSFSFYVRFKTNGTPTGTNVYNFWGKTYNWGEVNFCVTNQNVINLTWANSNTGNTYSYCQTIGAITPDTWTDLVITYENSNVKIYLNGVITNSTIGITAQGGGIISTANVNSLCNFAQDTNSSKIGSRITGGQTGSFFNGIIDDIGIWNRALTQEEITNLYLADTTCQSLVINTGILSFNPVTYNNTVTIYPNPANDHITIDCGNLANITGYQIKIVNTLGQEVFSGAMNTQQYVVPLNTWSGTGVYFVKIYDASNNLLNTKKIILQ